MSQSLILIDSLSSAFWVKEEKKKEREREKWPGAFFPGLETGHGLLAVPGGIFVAVRRNKMLI
jgi:hypothetical protein